ncbi:hypothetical protein L3X38_030942 [Prunus dulcis]|uniref:Uncharacterized protein n=1 Tax=Prunus dulcis TaxID=3755 RepID=A0AAD4VB99_PRUDU|nr:hypothetical protein L3X38_030942 [Prunus dulcis]
MVSIKPLPVSMATLSAGGMDESGGGAPCPWGRDQGHLVDLVQGEVKALLLMVSRDGMNCIVRKRDRVTLE